MLQICTDVSRSVMDFNAGNPGPIDESVLYDQDKHVSAAVWEGQVFPMAKFSFSYFLCIFCCLTLLITI